MGTIELRYFSTLQEVMSERGFAYPAIYEVGQGMTISALLADLNLGATEVEAVMQNGKVQGLDTHIMPGDRVALVPPGTPGPYRVMLGIKGRA
ncbi:MAG: MoaD/ThiS family protein [Peptococcaceae bacterium]|nr:MoaD/ThiS family protein [Peptococcaceae bacterium]